MNTNSFKYFIVVCLSLNSVAFGFDISQLRFSVLDIKDGLSQNKINNIYQDSKNYIWICTDEGINRYDGYNILKFDRQVNNKNSIVSNFTTCIAESSPGVFWIGTENGFSVYFYNNNKLLNFVNPPLIKKIIVVDSVSVIIQTPYSLYAARISQKNSKEYSIQLDPMYKFREAIYKDNANQIYLTDRDNNLYFFNTKTKLIKPQTENRLWNLLISKKINTVIKDTDDNFWIGTNSGLYKLNTANNEIDSFLFERKKILGLTDKIMGIAFGASNTIFISTYQHGILLFDSSTNRFQEYENDLYDIESIPDNKTTCILSDKSGTIWIGTKGAGVAYYSPYKYKFKHITQEPFKTAWLSNKYILSFAEDAQENIWIGTEGGGLYKYNTKENFISNWRNNSSSSSLSNDVVQALFIDNYNQLWIGTLNGICRFDKNKNTFHRYSLKTQKSNANLKLPSYALIRFLGTRENELYIFVDNAVYLFNPILNQFEKITFSSMPIPTNIIFRDIIEDKDGTWWAATNLGILHLDKQKGIIKNETLDKLNKKYFGTDQLYSLLLDGNNHIWIGTDNSGLFLFNKTKLTIEENYTKKEGLSNNLIYGILEDQNKKLWMSTNSGINVFDPVLKKFRKYDVNDGLQSNEFNAGAYYKTLDGKLLFGGINGLNIIDPIKVPFNAFKPITNIINIKTDVNNYTAFQYIQQEKKKVFQNSENTISFEFASSDYANTPKNNFEYKLEGYNNEWTSTKRNFITYTKLPPGNYTFYVRASNNDGIWSEHPASFKFRIKPLVWQTWWFKIFMILFILIYIYRFILERIQKIRRKEKEQNLLLQQKAQYEKQLAEIKLKALVAQMNPHFIFNSMNSIQAMILSDQNMQASTYLTKLSRLVRSVLENSIKTFIPLNDVIDNLKIYLELESLRFDKQFNYTIEVENVDIYSIEMPAMLLQPYVENAIWHGLIKKDGEKNIWIRFYKEENNLVCTIIDNGIGRAKAAELNLKKQHKSLGTIITKEMFDTLHKIKDTEYTVEIVDLYDEQQNAIGTKVIVRIELN
ncbi:MAG: two-component regulator propeller domain-containing protein [Chitinophagales bacterium]|nr:histidine kinase [Bacteroidota bacterium]